MLYNATTRMLTLEPVDCRACRPTREDVPAGSRPVFATVPCTKCHGTGKRGNGHCRACNGDYERHARRWDDNAPAAGFVRDYATVVGLVPCAHCGGEYRYRDAENFTDNAPAAALDALPLRVYRQERGNSWNEAYLGLGCLWACTDYGTAHGQTDAEVVAAIRADLQRHRVQACKIIGPYTRETTEARIADHLAVIVTRNGYSLRAVVTGDEVEDSARELDPNAAMGYGMAVYAAGGNGTIAAATAKSGR